MPGENRPEVKKDWYSYITMLKFYPGKPGEPQSAIWNRLETHLDNKVPILKQKDEVRILAAFYTQGQYDAVVLWQAKDPTLTKPFWNPITDFGTTETLMASPSDVW